MKGSPGPIIAIALVLCAPCLCHGVPKRCHRRILQAICYHHRHIHHHFHNQFTDIVAGPGGKTAQRHDAPKDALTRLLERVAGVAVPSVQPAISSQPHKYHNTVARIAGRRGIAFTVMQAIARPQYCSISNLTGFIPNQDKLYRGSQIAEGASACPELMLPHQPEQNCQHYRRRADITESVGLLNAS